MATKLLTIATGLVFSALPVWAQDGLKPVEETPPPVKDLGGWLGEQPATPPAEGATDPLLPPPAAPAAPEAGAPAPAVTETPPVDPLAEKKRGRQIDANYDKALKTYEDITQPHHKIEALKRRIANNEKIVRDYSARLATSGDERRRLQVELFNRTFYLKQQLEKGQIDQAGFDKTIAKEEREYEQRVKNLKSDIESWRREVSEAERRLVQMQGELRMLQAALPRAGRTLRGDKSAAAKAPRPGERLLSGLDNQLRALEKFSPTHTMDDVHPRDVGVSSVGRRKAAPAEDEEPPPEEEAQEE